ncbi:MAG: 4Fe-4S dicluster domain-containing protein [FCB group bacterium]|nr:4Fe-4S dicluster domain-containing protein [FCB group bacterium]
MTYWRVPLDLDQVEIPHGNIQIIVNQCKGCGFCVEYCPQNVLAMSTDFNRKGYHYPNIIKQDLCVNCNLCEIICPEFAIFVIEDKPRHPNPGDILKGGGNHGS